MTNTSKYKLYTYLFIILSLLVILLFGKPAFQNFSMNSKIKTELTNSHEAKNQEYNDLVKMKEDLGRGNTWEYAKYFSDTSEGALVDYFYSSFDSGIGNQITGISFNEWSINQYGFKEIQVNVSATFRNEEALLGYIQSYIIDSPQYELYLLSLNYSIGTPWPINITLPITLFTQ